MTFSGPDARPTVHVSVAISTLDRPESLGRCLDSLLTGTALPAEIVVVDQSSDQSARGVVEERSQPARIRYLSDGSRGLAAGQNAAVRESREPIVAVLDDDCVSAPDWLTTLAHVFDGRPELAAVGGRVLPLGPEQTGLYPVASRTSTTPREFRGSGLPWDVGSGNNFAVRREWFDRIGGCDERLGPGSRAQGGVDMDLFHRLIRAGGVVRYEPAAVVFHERKSRAERLARRYPYGRGMGACIALWRRQGDPAAFRVLRAWLALRSRIVLSAVRHGRWGELREESLVLAGTATGLIHGARLREPQ
jgi:GT2 family glycosyltransferase